MENIKLELKNARTFEKNIMKYANKVEEIHNELHEKAKDEKEFCGWIDLPSNYNKDEFENIKKSAKKIQTDSDVVLAVGKGGA